MEAAKKKHEAIQTDIKVSYWAVVYIFYVLSMIIVIMVNMYNISYIDMYNIYTSMHVAKNNHPLPWAANFQISNQQNQ